jgi:hypothetical protein
VCLGGVNVQDVSSPKSIEAKKLARHNQLSGFGRISLAAREACISYGAKLCEGLGFRYIMNDCALLFILHGNPDLEAATLWSAKHRFGRSGKAAFRKRPSAFVANTICHTSFHPTKIMLISAGTPSFHPCGDLLTGFRIFSASLCFAAACSEFRNDWRNSSLTGLCLDSGSSPE